MLDQLSVADFLSQQHYVDASKIGIWGWSFGGYMTARVLCKASPLIAAGMSVAPVTDWRFYDSIYTEVCQAAPVGCVWVAWRHRVFCTFCSATWANQRPMRMGTRRGMH